ncbi:GLUG motif-containing protein [Alkalibacter mobilis]|uniref:GLUG motif-containing protein n=1 Tax=Alkalibacter mobilis TaxID=2787712 RepID=UPI0018A0DA03|nr:GLUG motif-containing protein [Alkalibacter mobilis]MBF7097350.1 hypothetical protein [Alkalibacter mobilis]
MEKRSSFSPKIVFMVFIISLVVMGINSTQVFAFSGEGAGTEVDPYRIKTAVQLDEVRNDLDAYYELGNDIDLSEYLKANYPFNGWIPIGSESDPFTGSFDGKEYMIEGIFIDNYLDYVGFFGYVSDGGEYGRGTIKNLGIEINEFEHIKGSKDVDVYNEIYIGLLAGYNSNGTIINCYSIGTVTGDGFTVKEGGLVGYNSGIIEHCYSNGLVTGSGFSVNLGGLVGYNVGNILHCYSSSQTIFETYRANSDIMSIGGLVGTNLNGTIIDCYSSGIVKGDSEGVRLGGLVGSNDRGTIENCFSTSAVTGSGYYVEVAGLSACNWQGDIKNSYSSGTLSSSGDSHFVLVGGLVAYNIGNITNSYSESDCTGSGSYLYIGGLVARNESDSAVITNCYSIGAVTGSSPIELYEGGFMGQNWLGTLINCYYDQNTSGCSDTGKGEPRTTEEMMQQDTFKYWDFTNVWGIIEDATYPYLRAFQTVSDQTITVIQAPPTNATFGDTFVVRATASSELSVAIEAEAGCEIILGESGEGYATVRMISGTTAGIIHFKQAGNENYNSATEISFMVSAQKADATIEVHGTTVTYDGHEYGATGTAMGVDGEDLNVLLDLGATFTDVRGGTANWSFTDPNGNYNYTLGSVEIVIEKKEIQVIADDKTSQYSDPLKELTYHMIGFVEGEDENLVSGLPATLKTTATSSSLQGVYPITVSVEALSADNYLFVGVEGKYTITHETLYVKYGGDIFKWVNQDKVYGNEDDMTFINLKGILTQDNDGCSGELIGLKFVFKLESLSDNDGFAFESTVKSNGAIEITSDAVIPVGLYEITVEIQDNQYYTSAVDTKAVVVADSGNRDSRVEGSGSIVDCESDFGFIVNYGENKNATPTGSFFMSYETEEKGVVYKYVIKNNSWSRSGLYFISDVGAYFESKSTVKKFNMATGENVYTTGNSTFAVQVVDGDIESNEGDSVSVNVFNGKSVVFELGSLESKDSVYDGLNIESGGNILVVY